MTGWEPPNPVEHDLWRDTPGLGFIDKYAVLLLEAETHTHGKTGRPWVTFHDAVGIAYHLNESATKMWASQSDAEEKAIALLSDLGYGVLKPEVNQDEEREYHAEGVFRMESAADALKKILKQRKAGKRLKWTGPNNLVSAIAATCPPPSEQFTKKALRWNKEDQGRGFWDTFIAVAFQLGFHNGYQVAKKEDAMYRRWFYQDRLFRKRGLN